MILIRHAEPLEERRSQGESADPPLSERGRKQAEAVGEWLSKQPIDRVISSPALRARATAEPVARRMQIEVVVDPRLRDANAGADTYVPLEVDKARDAPAYQARIEAYRSSPLLAAISHRVNEALDEWASRCAGERVAVFCHGSVVNVFAARVLGLDRWTVLEPGYASAHRFMISRSGGRSVASLNETAYLASGV